MAGVSSNNQRKVQGKLDGEISQSSSKIASDMFSPLYAYPAYANHMRLIRNWNPLSSHAKQNHVASLSKLDERDMTPFGNSFWDIYPDTGGKPRPTWISEPKYLRKLIAILELEKEFSINVYYHSVDGKIGFISLIAISTWDDGDFLIDPLPLFGVIQEELKPVLETDAVTKIMYNCDQAIHQIRKCFSINMVRVMDAREVYYEMSHGHYATFRQLASAFYPEYKKGLLSVDEAQLDFCRRGQEFSENQGAYAINHTHFLLAVYDQMRSQCYMRKAQGAEWMRNAFEKSKSSINKMAKDDSMDFIETIDPVQKQLKDCWDAFAKNVHGFAKLSDNGKKLLKMLIEWRFHLANMIASDAPKVLSNQDLLAIARAQPANTRALRYILGPRFTYQIKKQSNVLIKLIKDGETYLEHLRHVQCFRCLGFFHIASCCKVEEIKSIFYDMPVNKDLKSDLRRRRRQNYARKNKSQDVESPY